MNASIRDITTPRRMRRLPVSPRGFPVPWFVAWLGGVPDFRCIGLGKLVKAIHQALLLAVRRATRLLATYAIGPMCIVKRNVAGVMIPRNPGVVALWITRSSKPFNVRNGVLFDLGEPERILGIVKAATPRAPRSRRRSPSGLPLLEAGANKGGPDAIKELSQCIASTQPLLPA